MLKHTLVLIFCITAFTAKAQYKFSGTIDNEQWQNTVYLSLIEDYRKITNIYTEQIFHKTPTDSLGNFHFARNIPLAAPLRSTLSSFGEGHIRNEWDLMSEMAAEHRGLGRS